MSELGPIGRLGRWTASHFALVVAAWVVVAVGFGVSAPKVEHALSGAGWETTGSESVQARQLIDRSFQGLGSYGPMVVVHSRQQTVGDPAFRRAVAQAQRTLAADPAVTSVVAPRPGQSISRDGHTAVVTRLLLRVGVRDRDITEQILLDRLEELGGRVHRPYLATGVSQTADGAEVTLDGGDVIEAQYVVAADGMNSEIRDAAGLGYDGDDALSLSFALADVRVEGGLPTDRVLLFFSTPGMLVVAPLPDRSFRLVAEVDDAPEQPDVAYAQRLLGTRGPRRTTASVTEVIWGSRFRIHERVADRYRAGRVLLAGDAAHTHSPAGGQGMNLGLRDAVTLGDALSVALREGRDDKLDEYAAGSRAEAMHVVALAHRLTRLATAPRAVRPLRNVALRLLAVVPAFRRGLAEQLSAIGHR